MPDFTARIRAELDTSGIEAKLKSIGNTKIELTNVSVGNTSMFTKSIQDAINAAGLKIDIGKADFSGITSAAKTAASNVSSTFSSALKSIDLVNGGVGNMSRMLQGAGFDKSAISTVTQDLSRMSIEVQKITTTMSKGNIKLNIQGTDELNRAVTIVREYDAATGKIVNTSKTFSQSFQTTAQAASEQAKSMEQAAKALSAEKKEAEAAAKAQQQLAQTQTKSATLSSQMSTWLDKNAQAASRYGDAVRALQANLQNNGDPTVLQNARLEFAKIKAEAQAAGLTTNSFATSLKNVAMQVTGLSSAAMVIRKVISEIKEGINTVVELDTALVDLKKTSSMSDNELSSYYYDANEIAKELGRTTQEIIQTSADWSRLGYGSYEDATRMSKMAAQFASISPGMSIEDSTNTLVSVMKAFDVQTNDVLDGVMSKINIVGNNFALSNADLAAGLMNSSSAMAVANNSLEETIALITAGTEITQNASKVGNGLRTDFCAYVQKCA